MLKKYEADFSTNAEIELNQAIDWYDFQQLGLGEIFYNEIDKVIASIERNPYYASVKYNETRVAFCKKFPFGVHYTINTNLNTVYITAIFNQNQLPFWEA